MAEIVPGVAVSPYLTKRTPFATYQRSAIEYKGLAIVDGQYLEARSLNGQKLKSWRSISFEMLDKLPASPQGPALLADNTWKSVEVDTIVLGSQHGGVLRMETFSSDVILPHMHLILPLRFEYLIRPSNPFWIQLWWQLCGHERWK